MATQILTIAQVVFSVLLIVAVLLQQRGAGLGAGFGGTGGGVYNVRRGPEKLLFQATVVISILLFGVSLVLVII